MLRERSALASGFLCFVCLLVLPPPQAAINRCSQDLIPRVKFLIDKAPEKGLDSKLYTPSIQDYTNCPSTTLKCFADEIKVLIDEWQLSKNRRKLNTKLQDLAAQFNEPESECRQCELLEEENAEKFLDTLLTTLMSMNSHYCKNASVTETPRPVSVLMNSS